MKGQQNKRTELELFEKAVISLRPEVREGGSASGAQGESNFISGLARKRALTGTLLETAVSNKNLNRAYKSVRGNGGIGGVDGMDVEGLEEWLKGNSKELVRSVLTGEYEPDAVMGLEIPKTSGGMRLLGIPTVRDRLVQQAIQQQLTLVYEPLFSGSSYGFRPNRSALQAVSQASEYASQGHEWVVDIDMKSFFDHINHDRLMQRLSKSIGDRRLLRLIQKYLKSGLMLGGLTQQRTSGTPQGGPLSPLLSNVVLDELDKELERRGHLFVRYADDCNIYVKSERAGERVLSSLTKFLEGKLKLKVNKEKSGVRHCSKVKFLGYTIMPDGRIRIADKSLQRFKTKVRELTKRNRGVSFTKVIGELNEATRGWVNYFRLANCWLPWKMLDGWIRRRLRCYRLKQCGRKYTLVKFLQSLGVGKHKAWNAILHGGTWWQLSSKIACSKAMGIKWFAELGLYALADLHKRVKR